jgi:hypothetical protein
VSEQSKGQSAGVLSICGALSDFGGVMPRVERKGIEDALRQERDEFFNEVQNQWDEERRYSVEEANFMAQRRHRHRLIIFSNFLTTVCTVTLFEPNLIEILADAQPCSVVMVLGGRRGLYPHVYEYIARLASSAGFQLKVAGENVSSAETAVADKVYAEGKKVYELLQSLEPSVAEETREVRSHFANTPQAAPSSLLWAYRKYR